MHRCEVRATQDSTVRSHNSHVSAVPDTREIALPHEPCNQQCSIPTCNYLRTTSRWSDGHRIRCQMHICTSPRTVNVGTQVPSRANVKRRERRLTGWHQTKERGHRIQTSSSVTYRSYPGCNLSHRAAAPRQVLGPWWARILTPSSAGRAPDQSAAHYSE